MKTKRILALILNFVLLCSLIISFQITSSAEGSDGMFSLKFALTDENGNQVVFAKPNDIITVSFAMQRTDSDAKYTTNGFQNYIHYDKTFFEFVEGSIVCNDTGNATAKKQKSITYGEIIQCQNMGKTYESSFVFCTFSLKIIADSGSGMVYNDDVYVFDTKYQSVKVTEQHLRVVIDVGCLHESKTKVESAPSTCESRGWSGYYVCNDCGVIFDESGNHMISDIPYIDEAHNFGDSYVCDEIGHWCECITCGEKSEYSSHNGGTATCKNKGKCVVCGQYYGNIDESNHDGETVLKNAKSSGFLTNGYSGDIHCAECGGLIESGHSLPKLISSELDDLILILSVISVILIGGFVYYLFDKRD